MWQAKGNKFLLIFLGMLFLCAGNVLKASNLNQTEPWGQKTLETDDVICSFPSLGVWQRDSTDGKWTRFSKDEARQICSGDINGDGLDDLLGWWPSNQGIWMRNTADGNWSKLSHANQLIWLANGDINGDQYDDLIGSWDIGVWVKDSLNGSWQRLHAQPADMIASGDFNGDGIDDLLGKWGSAGIWMRYSHNSVWTKVMASENLLFLTAADMNGDGTDELLGSWTSGVWQMDFTAMAWTKLSANPAQQLTAGDLDGDGKADVIGRWANPAGVWVYYSRTAAWERITNQAATWMCTGLLKKEIPEPIGKDQLKITFTTTTETTTTLTGKIRLENPNTSYEWNGSYFVTRTIDFKTTSQITSLQYMDGGSPQVTIAGDTVKMDLTYRRFFDLAEAVELIITVTKQGNTPIPQDFKCNYVGGNAIYPQYQGLPSSWQPQKPNLSTSDLIFNEQEYYQTALNANDSHMIVYNPAHPTQIIIGQVHNVGVPINNTNNVRIWMPTRYLAMGIGFAYQAFRINPNYLCALTTKENWGCGVSKEPSGTAIELDGETWWWPIQFDHPDGPFQVETGNFNDAALMFPDYFPPNPVHDDYTKVSSDLTHPNWISSAVTTAISLTITREELNAVPEYDYISFVAAAIDPYAEQSMITFAYNRGLGSFCGKKIFTENRVLALNSLNMCETFDLGGFAGHVPTVQAVMDAMNGETADIYDAEISWTDLQNFFTEMRTFYANGIPSTADWNLMLEDVERGFNVLKQHWGGNHISFRYDFLTVLRIAQFYLPKPAPPRPTGQQWYWTVNGITPPPNGPGC